ncbi:hypothetical protein LOTGIDRAFT_155256 [Lottia gigantea]|uniref:Uncharacterized protein n=1 Tax=Lottia gigantea TaxID=225164 RepID=V3ZST5_LOTGI|nr:hypothetical protein LOTGIDRAFT_155256 [Lottia gigantea]ESO83951.1 hypothetical protein LOTGIDRAFT_155256 [Lottia gigantea]
MAEIQVSRELLKEKLRPSRSSVTGSSTKGGRKKGLNSDSPKQIDNTTNSLPGCSTGNNNNSSTSVFKSNIFASSSKSKDGSSVEPSNSDVMSILKAIQENQTAQNSRFDKLSSKVDELYNNDNYDDYDENELLGYNDEEYCDDDLDVLPAKKAKISSDMELSDYIFAQAGKKLKTSLINNWFRDGVDDDRYNELIKSIPRPKNCETLMTVKTNQLVWDFLSQSTRTMDKRIQNAQTSIIKGAVSLSKITDTLGSGQSMDVNHVPEQAMDSLAPFGHANKQLCFIRRDLMKPDMRGEYLHLCSQNLKYTDSLFGDDVSKTVKDISDCSRISNKIGAFQGRGGQGRSIRGRGFRGRFFRGHYRGRSSGGFYGSYGSDSRRVVKVDPSPNNLNRSSF